VPDAMLLTLCREIAALCEGHAAQEGSLPDEEDVWQRMLEEHPDWFETMDMPGERELFTLVMMNREEEAHAYT